MFAVLDHLDIERAYIGGMSQGGYTALRCALTHPQRVNGLALISTQRLLDNPPTIALYQQLIDAYIEIGPSEPLASTITNIILGCGFHSIRLTTKRVLTRTLPAICR